ncbi:hypothetical protein BGZ81_002763 [Podila clonocystis]|nr:hypothetical protein BGZ81_002763 [Podila clonocystis]
MILKTLPLILSAAIAMAVPIVDVVPESEYFIRIPIFNKNPIDLSTVHAMDVARWAPLGNINANDFASQAEAGYVVTPVINELTSYTLVSALGTPKQSLELIFDSGSSNLLVQPAYYNPSLSTTHKKLDETFVIEYGSANSSGTYHNDVFSLEGVSISQDFGIIDHVVGISPRRHGIVGVGPDVLTRITSKDRVVPTPMDNLLAAEKIKSNVFGVYFERMKDGGHSIRNGEVVFGGYDSSRYSGDIIWADAPTEFPENHYWGLIFDKITFGDIDISADPVNGISDTGTSLILLSASYFKALKNAIPDASIDKGMIAFPPSSLSSLKDLTFVVKGKSLTITPEQYTLKPLETSMMGGDASKSYIWIGENTSAPNLGVMLGQKFLEYFYSIYDGENNRVGFAPVKVGTSADPTTPEPVKPTPEPVKPTPEPVKPTTPAPCDKSKICCRLFGNLNKACCLLLGC